MKKYHYTRRGVNTEWAKTSITKTEHHKIFKLINDLTVSEFETRKWIEVNDLLGGQNSNGKNIRLKIKF